jgi:hypothetical protein
MIIRMSITLFEIQERFIPTITDLIQYGGIELLKQVITMYEKNEFLQSSVPKLLKTVLGNNYFQLNAYFFLPIMQ